MQNFETTEDLKREALKFAGELSDGTSDYDGDVIPFMNDLLRDLHKGSTCLDVDLGEIWPWARKSGILTLLPPYETGTVTCTIDSTSGTFNTAPGVSLGSFLDYFLLIDGVDTIYRIAAHTAGAGAFTLDQAFLEATGTRNFRAIKLDYALTSGLERPANAMRTQKRQASPDDDGSIKLLEYSAFQQHYPLRYLQSGVPDYFSPVSLSEGSMVVRFNRFPLEKSRVDYDYMPQAKSLILKTFLDAAVTAASDLITISQHGLQNDQIVRLTSTGTLPAGLSLDTNYYVISATATTFKLSASLGGSAVDITAAAGGGTHTVSVVPPMPFSERAVLAYYAAHLICLRKKDARMDYYRRLAQSGLQAMKTAVRRTNMQTNSQFGRMLPRTDAGPVTGLSSDRYPRIYN